jgi:hypothetical protein
VPGLNYHHRVKEGCNDHRGGDRRTAPYAHDGMLSHPWTTSCSFDFWPAIQTFRVLTVVDNWGRESPVLEKGIRLTGGSAVERSVGLQDVSPASIRARNKRKRLSQIVRLRALVGAFRHYMDQPYLPPRPACIK